ncbi:hypothetical protein TREES_T100021469 [Tupaia chinensis]|uniref:Uncharacterized protein n=1 Tax=Tupaia chinensis TaxID=246437 RepID=L9KHY0_TUPCH|nr:hypothetical protein TREES_T100021469 [Tupaia chinensis]
MGPRRLSQGDDASWQQVVLRWPWGHLSWCSQLQRRLRVLFTPTARRVLPRLRKRMRAVTALDAGHPPPALLARPCFCFLTAAVTWGQHDEQSVRCLNSAAGTSGTRHALTLPVLTSCDLGCVLLQEGALASELETCKGPQDWLPGWLALSCAKLHPEREPTWCSDALTRSPPVQPHHKAPARSALSLEILFHQPGEPDGLDVAQLSPVPVSLRSERQDVSRGGTHLCTLLWASWAHYGLPGSGRWQLVVGAGSSSTAGTHAEPQSLPDKDGRHATTTTALSSSPLPQPSGRTRGPTKPSLPVLLLGGQHSHAYTHAGQALPVPGREITQRELCGPRRVWRHSPVAGSLASSRTCQGGGRASRASPRMSPGRTFQDSGLWPRAAQAVREPRVASSDPAWRKLGADATQEGDVAQAFGGAHVAAGRVAGRWRAVRGSAGFPRSSTRSGVPEGALPSSLPSRAHKDGGSQDEQRERQAGEGTSSGRGGGPPTADRGQLSAPASDSHCASLPLVLISKRGRHPDRQKEARACPRLWVAQQMVFQVHTFVRSLQTLTWTPRADRKAKPLAVTPRLPPRTSSFPLLPLHLIIMGGEG